MEKAKILIVEDDIIQAKSIESLLLQLGYESAGLASTGAQAVEKALEAMPDLILIDIQLKGGMDGITAVTVINEKQKIPCIYLTAYSDEKTIQRAKATEPYAYLTKPVSEKDLQSNIETALYKAGMEKRLRESEQKFRRRNGSPCWLSVSSTPLTDAQGTFAGSFGMCTDITERKRAETALREKHQLLASIFNASPIGIFCLDRGGCVTAWSKASEHMFGWTEEEVLGRLNPIVPDDRMPEFLSIHKSVIAGNPLVTKEVVRHKKDGSPIVIHLSVTPLQDDAGQIVGATGMCMDITERRLAEEALRENEARYKALIENIDLGITLLDTEHRIIMVNKKHAEIFKKPADYFPGKYCYREFEKREQVCPHCPGIAAMKSGKAAEVITKGVLDDGSTRDARVMAFPLFENNKTAGFIEVVEDITDRKKAEDALRESEERFRAIANYTVDWENWIGRDGRPLWVSPSVERLTGYTAEECLEMPGFPLSLVFEEDRAREAQNFKEAVHADSSRKNHQFRFVRKDGRVRWADVSWQPIFDSHGRPMGHRSSIRDITETKQAEIHIKESRDFLDKIFTTSADGIVITAEYSRIIMTNDAMEKILGYSRNELIGKAFYDFMPPGDIHDIKGREMITQLFEEGVVNSSEQQYMHKNGHIVDVELSATFIKDDADNITGAVGVFRDITARKRSEEERMRLLAAIEQVAENIIFTDAKGVIQYVNTAVWKKTGVPREKIIGQNLFFPPGRSGETKKNLDTIWETVSSGSVWEGRVHNLLHNGSVLHLSAIITPIINDSGVITNYVNVSRDITRELDLEAQLLQSQKLEALGTLAGGIAHDFNNILGGIYNYNQLIQDDIPGGSPAADYLEENQKLISRAINLVKQILAFSRKSMLERKPVNLSTLIKEVTKMLRATIPTTIEITAAIDEHTGQILSDPTQLHQILMNLCTNAAQAMHERGGVLHIGLCPIALTPADLTNLPDMQPGPYAKLTVRDTGTGIRPDILNRIFEPFFTTKDVGKGTGMGLAVVYGIVKSHSGAITVESTPGEGSTFTVLLPRVAEDEAERVTQESPVPKGTESILFIDDEKMLIDSGTKILESLGYSVTALESSTEALAVFRKSPEAFDLVITDYTMPKMTGCELIQKLLQIRKDIPVILCTGYSEMASEERSREIGAGAFIMKPIRKRDIAETIRKVLGKK